MCMWEGVGIHAHLPTDWPVGIRLVTYTWAKARNFYPRVSQKKSFLKDMFIFR